MPTSDDDTGGGAADLAARPKGIKRPRRNTRLLEVGAINTQLLDAAARTRARRVDGGTEAERVHRLNVRAIDLRATDPRIEQVSRPGAGAAAIPSSAEDSVRLLRSSPPAAGLF